MKLTLATQIVDLGDSLAKFKTLFSRYWIYVRAIVISTRSYDDGLIVVEKLEKLNEIYKKDNYLSETEYRKFQTDIILFKLELLDKKDDWDEFIHFFEQTLQNRNVHTLTYHPAVFAYVDPKSHYVVRFDTQYIYMHPLYLSDHRYQLIKKKIDRRSKNKKINNLQHKLKSDLSEEEIQSRFSTIMKAAEEGQRVYFSGYY
ncbi:MAG: hypothetical protein HEQ29_01900 [Dolichospermum sp. LBC05a]|nr:hypothetical protein [Dolichospermum sp. OL01]MCO5795605.1 hypothetical protein [Dolichospermum sp. OL03]MCS6281407.1 hypothetical protein [Dolichospermum sp.]QSV57298.1 MAG: hypothetical protein HEQ29_01900 [Dolichospermum sp. LBC05a]